MIWPKPWLCIILTADAWLWESVGISYGITSNHFLIYSFFFNWNKSMFKIVFLVLAMFVCWCFESSQPLGVTSGLSLPRACEQWHWHNDLTKSFLSTFAFFKHSRKIILGLECFCVFSFRFCLFLSVVSFLQYWQYQCLLHQNQGTDSNTSHFYCCCFIPEYKCTCISQIF